MNQENQEPKKANTEDQKADDSSRSPGVDRGSPGVDRGLGSSENTPKKNTEKSNQES
ncbi:hypothetical protein IQ247_14795 [Plectonema cf. radiosum LEGE 06105]|uniref:Uncharacterized protein n=1 Tax=Plectonema cf. radiosum LEGE 06105 TaxID=945769 RepID=A0A8J7F4D3_9CYAN|nr:hypothetical protein [Plectonema radiosum]MBE9213918.1 hypothetical protein [Plectonema cf. radiosum LEGE 06105]